MNDACPSSPFGLLAWLQHTAVRLPLRTIDYHFTALHEAVEVTVEQCFVNTNSEALNVVYTFPLPASAAVYRCEMVIDGRVVRAEVEEIETARRRAEEAKAEGFQTALVEQHRDNLFSLELGNVPAASVIVVRLSYVQEVESRLASRVLTLPTCPGVRYIPGEPLLRANRGPGVSDDTLQVPDASWLNPPRISSAHPDAARLSVSGCLSATDVDPSTVTSPSHLLLVRESGETISVSFGRAQECPDQSIVIKWAPARLEPDQVLVVTAQQGGNEDCLVRMRGPDTAPTMRVEEDLWILLDASSSMEGVNWTQCSKALREMLVRLPDEQYVGMSLFNSHVFHYSERLERVGDLRAQDAVTRLTARGPDASTELYPALLEVKARWDACARPGVNRRLLLLTDGQVGNEPGIVSWADSVRSELTVSTFGMDTAANDALLVRLAEVTGGRSVVVHPQDDYVEAVLTLLQDLEPPVVTGIGFGAGWQAERAKTVLARRAERVELVQRTEVGAGPLEVSGLTSLGERWTPSHRRGRMETSALALLQAKRRIQELDTRGDVEDAIALAKQFNLLSRFTSFIAVDRTSKKAVARRALVQPVQEGVHDMCRSASVCRSDLTHSHAFHGRVIEDLRASRLGRFSFAEWLSDCLVSLPPSFGVDLVELRWVLLDADRRLVDGASETLLELLTELRRAADASIVPQNLPRLLTALQRLQAFGEQVGLVEVVEWAKKTHADQLLRQNASIH